MVVEKGDYSQPNVPFLENTLDFFAKLPNHSSAGLNPYRSRSRSRNVILDCDVELGPDR